MNVSSVFRGHLVIDLFFRVTKNNLHSVEEWGVFIYKACLPYREGQGFSHIGFFKASTQLLQNLLHNELWQVLRNNLLGNVEGILFWLEHTLG